MMKDKLVEGYGFIGTDPNTLYKFGNGKYKTFEGTEIVAENCVKAKVKDLRVEGKTYQNLFKAELSQGHVNSSLTAQQNLRVNSEGFTLEVKTYTISVPSGYEILVYKNYVDINSVYIVWKNKIAWSNSSETNNIRIMIRKLDDSNITVDEVIGKVILLEGDYTDTDLPNSINGIESVSEKENNILSVKINDNTTTLNLPIPLRSLPNGVADTIEGNKLVQRVEKIILDGSNDENWKVNKSLYFSLNHSSTKTPKEFFNPNLTEYLNAISNISISHHTILDNKNGFGITYCYFWRLNLEEVDATKGATVDDLKSYLKENPVTVYYELETPIVHDLEIPSISTTKGTNVITTTNNIKPNLKIKVKVK